MAGGEGEHGRGERGESLRLVILYVYRLTTLENVPVDMVDCARVKDVLEVSVRSRWQGRG